MNYTRPAVAVAPARSPTLSADSSTTETCARAHSPRVTFAMINMTKNHASRMIDMLSMGEFPASHAALPAYRTTFDTIMFATR